MSGFISRLVSEATAPIGELGVRLFKMAMLVFFVVCCLIASAIFLTIALFDYLQPLAGYAGAALGVGSAYLLASLIAIVAARRSPRRDRPIAAALMDDKENIPPQKAEFVTNIDKTLAPILQILQEAGMDRERLALQSGAEIAKQLRPFSLVAFVLFAGMILGRLMWRDGAPRA